jgi:hypothetical protein
MMLKSLLHQTLAKLFSETERSLLFCYCIYFLKNINHSTESIVVKNQNSVNYFFTVVFLQHILVWVSGFEPPSSSFQGKPSDQADNTPR